MTHSARNSPTQQRIFPTKSTMSCMSCVCMSCEKHQLNQCLTEVEEGNTEHEKDVKFRESG